MSVTLNKPIPEFEAQATGNITINKEALHGKTVVLFFYPKDNTPGCTNEATEFRDAYQKFIDNGVEVIGISRDNIQSHEQFKQKLGLPYPLIADVEEKICHAFGVVKNKIMYGKKVKGIQRSTFLVDANGILRQEWRGVKVDEHVQEILKEVKKLA